MFTKNSHLSRSCPLFCEGESPSGGEQEAGGDVPAGGGAYREQSVERGRERPPARKRVGKVGCYFKVSVLHRGKKVFPTHRPGQGQERGKRRSQPPGGAFKRRIRRGKGVEEIERSAEQIVAGGSEPLPEPDQPARRGGERRTFVPGKERVEERV